jgi:hypothetical protein
MTAARSERAVLAGTREDAPAGTAAGAAPAATGPGTATGTGDVIASGRLMVRPLPLGLDGIGEVESFMSWFSRLAWSNGFRSIRQLCRAEGIPCVVTSDLAHCDQRLGVLELVGLGVPAHRAMSLDDLLAPSGSVGTGGSRSNWVLPRQADSRGVPHQVCPECIAGQATPYWTKASRMSYVTQCPVHNVMLLSHCPSCNGQLVLHEFRASGLTHCAGCRLDLRGERGRLQPGERVPAHWRDASQPTPHPCASGAITQSALWKGIRAILLVLCDPKLVGELLRVPLLHAHHRLFVALAAGPELPFDRHRCEQRHQMLVFAAWLMEDWEKRILALQAQVDMRKAFRRVRGAAQATWISEFFRPAWPELQLAPAERYAASLTVA